MFQQNACEALENPPASWEVANTIRYLWLDDVKLM